MIQDGDHRLDRLGLDRPITEAARVSHFTWARIGLKSQVPFDLHYGVVGPSEPETYPRVGQRLVAEHQRQLLAQSACHSLLGRAMERRQAFNTLPDQADKWQKEP